MDATKVETFCAAATLLPALSQYAAVESHARG